MGKAHRKTNLRLGKSNGSYRHGQAGSPEHLIWKGIVKRCVNPKSRQWQHYGGIGVTVCNRWRSSFAAFLADMGRRPSPDHSIDRFPNKEGNYEPGNCRWATQKDQCRNKRNNRLITHNGDTQPLIVWAERSGLSKITLTMRLNRGWPIEKALQPLKSRRERSSNRLISYKGRTACIAEWCEITGFSKHTIQHRLAAGWSDTRIIETPLRLTKRSRLSA
jgi:hypothetical protein